MFKKLLKRFGYEKVDFTRVDSLNPIEYEEMLDALRNVPNFQRYLKSIMDSDVNRFYSCQESEQAIVRGARSRTSYILNLLTEDKKKSKVSFNKRYL